VSISIEKYRRKLSGLIVDRIDLWVEVSSIGFDKIIDKSLSESSYKIKEKVLKARQEQLKRKEVFGVSLNKDLKTKDLQNFKLDDGCQKVLKDAVLKFGLSTRSYYKLLKISRTIADLDQSPVINMSHIMEALQYRRKQDF
jgi:magnesium chelatase family protein